MRVQGYFENDYLLPKPKQIKTITATTTTTAKDMSALYKLSYFDLGL